MPSRWDTEVYRTRARAWREEAAGLPLGGERDACLAVAEGYENLVRLARLAWPSKVGQARGASVTLAGGGANDFKTPITGS